MPIPARIQNPPELKPGLELFYSAWTELDSCRPAAFGPMPIPWTAMQQWAEVNELDEIQTEELMFFLPRMDKAFLEWHAKKKKKKD